MYRFTLDYREYENSLLCPEFSKLALMVGEVGGGGGGAK